MLFYRFLFLGVAVLISCSQSASAHYFIPETKSVPVDRLISNLEAKLQYEVSDPRHKAWSIHQLARLCAMAYSLKLTTVKQFVPGKHSSSDGPDFASIYPPASPYGDLGDHPREIPDPEAGGKGEFLDKAIKYYKIYLETEPKDWRGHMGLGWTLILKGDREAAKASLRKALDLSAPANLELVHRPDWSFDGINPKAVPVDADKITIFQDFLFPPGVKTIEVAQGNGQKQVLNLEKAALESLKASAYMTFTGKLSGLLPKFQEFIRQWEKKRSPAAYREFRDVLPANLPGPAFTGLYGKNEFDPRFYPFKEQFFEFEERFIRKTENSKEAGGNCLALKGVAQFQEFTVRNSDVCLIKRAFKEKNWGICRNGMADGMHLPFSFNVCISVLAARSKSEKICQDVAVYLGSLFKGFNPARCERTVKESWGSAFDADSYRFGQRMKFSKFLDSFETYSPNENEGAFRIVASFTREGGVKIDHLILRSSESSWQGEGQSEERRISVPKDVAVRIPHTVSFFDRNGKAIGKMEVAGYFMPTEADFKKRAENYDISASLGRIGSAEIARYLVPLLDKDKDKKEITSIKRRVWKSAVDSALTPRGITPLALPLVGHRDTGHPINESATIRFDLDGSGIKKPWEWIKPSFGWLVYLPGSSRVSSGLQMFGSVTFWLFWRDGFESLCSLDDDRNGVVRGKELKNIKIWNDRNLDGVQSKEELLTLESQGIVGLKCNRANYFSQGLILQDGVELKDGTTRNLYDVWLKGK